MICIRYEVLLSDRNEVCCKVSDYRNLPEAVSPRWLRHWLCHWPCHWPRLAYIGRQWMGLSSKFPIESGVADEFYAIFLLLCLDMPRTDPSCMASDTANEEMRSSQDRGSAVMFPGRLPTSRTIRCARRLEAAVTCRARDRVAATSSARCGAFKARTLVFWGLFLCPRSSPSTCDATQATSPAPSRMWSALEGPRPGPGEGSRLNSIYLLQHRAYASVTRSSPPRYRRAGNIHSSTAVETGLLLHGPAMDGLVDTKPYVVQC